MDRIKFLQTKKLLKELDYIQSDYDYKNEVISEADSQFILNINMFLEKYPKLKEIYNNRTDSQIINKIESKINLNINDDLIMSENKPLHIKKIYREIVKLTHPDIVSDKILNEYYISATDLYNHNNEVGIYKICMDLNIDKYLDEIDSKLIEEQIGNLKNRIAFLENTLAWMWLNAEDETYKQELLIKYIRARLQ